MNNKMIKLATAAAVIIAALIGFHAFSDSSSTVYADVVRQLQKARTLIYTVTSLTPIEGMPEMEMEIAFKEPGYMRITAPGGYASVFNSTEGKGLSIIPDKKQFVEIDMTNLPDDIGQREFDVIEKLRTLPERADEDLGEQIMDGRTVHGFRVNEGGLTNTVWIEPKSRELILVEIEFDNAPGMSGTMSNFQFDVELDDSLFSLTPPEGYTQVVDQLDASEIGEEDLIQLLRLWTTWTKDSTFPPTLNPVELPKMVMEMENAGKFDNEQSTDQPNPEHVMLMTRGLMFVIGLPTESNWRYAGENVMYGQADTPIFWYQPEGSQTYRVIYGDLSVKDVALEDLPD
jgi:outer membrane lipoprotein-sorting protein